MTSNDLGEFESGLSDEIYDGKRAAYFRVSVPEVKSHSSLEQRFKADPYRNKRMRLTAYIKSESVGWAGLWMRVEGKPRLNTLGFDNMWEKVIKGTTEWQRYSVVLDVPEESIGITFGFYLMEKGGIWINNVQFEETDDDLTGAKDYADEPRNLDFVEG
jgi:hypothetical protein